MQLRFLYISVVVCVLGAGLALPQTKSTTTSKKKSVTTARKGRSTKGKAAPAPAHYRQSTPTPDRYKEIQQALVDKGYLKSAPSGVWDNDSQDAMKRFQADKNLPSTGKITAPSLIGLGLGPKNNNSETPIAPDSTPASPPPAN